MKLYKKDYENILNYYNESFDQDNTVKELKKKVENIIDTVGAGDSFTALFIYGLIKDQDLNIVMQNAADFASLICQTAGAVPNDLAIYNNYKV